MLADRLKDRHAYGLGVAARHIGEWADAFRPQGEDHPLDPQNRYLRLPAYFQPARGGTNQTAMPGDSLWHGIFDSAYTRVGDYIRVGSRAYFIASQYPLLPVLCVQTNRRISLARPVAQIAASTNSYDGYTAASAVSFMTNWPASVLSDNRTAKPEASLPTDVPAGSLSILLPQFERLVVSTGDLLTDDLSRSAVIVGAELTDLGWRLAANLIVN